MPPFLFANRRVRLSGLASGLASSLLAFALTVMAQGPPAGSAAPPARPPYTPPKLSVTTHEVLLDVLVTDAANHPVTGLTAADFTLTEEGDPQSLKRVREHQPISAAEAAKLRSAPSLPPNTFTNYSAVVNTNAATVILLDALDTPVSAQMYLRQQLIQYLKTMPPGASIAIFQMDTQMRLIQGFTSDQAALEAAANSKRNMPSLQGEFYRRHPTLIRMRRILMRDGMRAMGRYLAGFPGRKNLIWFTGELPLDIYGNGLGNPFHDSFRLRDDAGNEDDTSDFTDVLTVNRVALYPVDTRGLMTDPQFDAERGGSPGRYASLRFANRQAFDHSNLDMVASATGGKAFYNTNGLSETIAEVVNNGSYYYTLAYSTTNKDWRGQFRKIKVTVNRPGVRLQHREGYYAINREQLEQRQLAVLAKRKAEAARQQGPPEIRDGEEPSAPGESAAAGAAQPLAETVAGTADGAVIPHTRQGGFAGAMALGAVAPTELVLVAQITPENKVEKMDKNGPPPGNFMQPDFRGKPFRTYSITVKADAHRFRLTKTPDGIRHGRVEFAAVVYDASGAKVNSALSTATIDMHEDTYREMLATGAVVHQTIAIPVKGNYFLRLGAHDFGGDQIGALEIPVDQVRMEAATAAH